MLKLNYFTGIIHTAGSQYAEKAGDMGRNVEPEVEDDPTTKFYKSRFKKSSVSDTEGRTPIYDFDEWSRQHYGSSFQRRQTAKEKFDRNQKRDKEQVLMMQNEILLFSVMVLSALAYLKFYSESSYDFPKEKAIRLAEENAKNEGSESTT